MTKIIYKKITIKFNNKKYSLKQRDSCLFIPKSKLIIYDFVDSLNSI